MISRLNEIFVVLISVLILSLKFPFELKEIKQNVVFSKEKKIDELKTSLLVLFEQCAKKEKSFTSIKYRKESIP